MTVAKMPTKRRKDVHFEIEGYFPIGHVAALMRTDPTKWERDWKLWHRTENLFDARRTKKTGMMLAHRTCPISYTLLRIVRVDKNGRKVIK